jgi:hypothetical protein
MPNLKRMAAAGWIEGFTACILTGALSGKSSMQDGENPNVCAPPIGRAA